MTTLRVRSVTPIRVGPEELRRRQARYDQFSPAGVQVVLEDLPASDAMPRQLATRADIEASDAAVAEVLLDTRPDQFDVLLPDCVLDPGLDRIRAADPAVPAVGLSELVSRFVTGLGLPLAAVARNRPIGEELDRRLRAYGLGGHYWGVEVLDLSFDDIADDARWNAALSATRDRLTGVGAILNGCSAVDVATDGGVPVFDPARLALRLLGVAADERLLADR
jgi:allantoin racemase